MSLHTTNSNMSTVSSRPAIMLLPFVNWWNSVLLCVCLSVGSSSLCYVPKRQYCNWTVVRKVAYILAAYVHFRICGMQVWLAFQKHGQLILS